MFVPVPVFKRIKKYHSLSTLPVAGALLGDLSAGRPRGAREALQLTAAPPRARPPTPPQIERGAGGVLGAEAAALARAALSQGDDAQRAACHVCVRRLLAHQYRILLSRHSCQQHCSKMSVSIKLNC